MNENLQQAVWAENVILADADYIDKVAFNLIVNFERMLERRIPKGDLARWIDCVALDGGLRPGAHETQVVLIHSAEKLRLDNFLPSDFSEDLHQKAFHDHLGEFAIAAYPTEAFTTKEDFFIEALQMICQQKDVKRLMVIPNAEEYYERVRQVLRGQDDRHTTVFTMQPMMGGDFRQEILGYSIMAALGITAEDIKEH